MTKERSSTARGRELGEELRRVRNRAGLTGGVLAEELEWSAAKVSKLEKGWRGASEGDIGAFLGRCGADKATREQVLRFAAEPVLDSLALDVERSREAFVRWADVYDRGSR